MPIESQPSDFNMKDLFIDVKLEACVDGSSFDFLGRKMFSTEFFRKNIGFGITSVDIEVNTSLQPIVTVVFKDLYGATVFGGQNRNITDDNQSIDYSVLFDWPPPKFLFSFKGYLGKPTTWVLNLKKTSTSFNSSDGSYDVKCEFVPNQWGFFADLPFLYLLSAKRLRKDKIGDLTNLSASEKARKEKSITSVFDLIKIGKQVNVKTKDTTKEFDGLNKQLGSIKSNVSRAASVSNIIGFGDVIDGVVNNQPIKGFVKIKIPKIEDINPYNTKEKIEQNLGNTEELTKMNTLILLSIGFNHNLDGQTFVSAFDESNGENIISKELVLKSPNDSNVVAAKNQVLKTISNNSKLIDAEIQRRIFATEEKKLEKITIGEVFSQLAKDSGFIMGSIIDAGLNGYRGDDGRFEKRNRLSDVLIGQAFPMVINEKGEEVPATKENLGDDVGVDENEMEFVRGFIRAISEGIARDLTSNSDSIPGEDDSVLKHRINNCEMTLGNPYKPFYANIATNILVRSGIVAYMTRSNDPNRPGDYGNTTNIDNDGKQQIEEIATRDSQNITDSMLASLSDVDVLLLKRFCNFFKNFYRVDTTFGSFATTYIIKTQSGETEDVREIEDPEKDSIYEVVMSSENDTLTFKTLWDELKQPKIFDNVSVSNGQLSFVWDEVELSSTTSSSVSFKEVDVEPDKGERGGGRIKKDAQNPLSFVDDKTFTAVNIVNNGIPYMFPDDPEVTISQFLFPSLVGRTQYWMVLFRGEDNRIAQEVDSSPTDIEYRSKDKDDPDGIWGKEEPLGYVPVNAKYDEEGNELDRIDNLIKFSPYVLDFNKLKRIKPDLYRTGFNDKYFQWVKEDGSGMSIASDSIELQQLGGKDNAELVGDFGYTIAHHSSESGLVFGFFENTREGVNQRIYVKKMCDEIISRLEKLEDERNQVIGSVLGKAGEEEGTLYKQMHTLYHQWQSLAYSSGKVINGSLCSGDVDETKSGDSGVSGKVFNVAEMLEIKYGSNHINLVSNEEVKFNDENGVETTKSLTNQTESNGVPDGTFIYDYPLQRINEDSETVQVRDSIIDLEPLYKANGRTTVLNVIQQICTKNNFLFVPIPGNPNYLNPQDIYTPYSEPANIDIKNFFHVLFTPTPESRTKTKNTDGTPLALSENHKNFKSKAFPIKYGSPSNQVISNIQVGTDDTKVTAESIVNLQRLVDNENQNKKVTTDCSMLSVMAGRSYNASIDMLGNAQVYPIQFFFLENSPLFGGLYQIMKVKHTISPNDFKTSVDGMRMRFSSKYGSVRPITLQTFRDLGKSEAPLALDPGFDEAQRELLKKEQILTQEGANNPIGNFTREQIELAVKSKGYKWFDTKGDYELNIVGVRNTNTGNVVTNRFDDYITLSYKVDGEWKFWSWQATTQPGQKPVENPSRPDGVAILKPGQYINSHIIRAHGGSYMALGQNGMVTVYRDNNKDLFYNEKESNTQTGGFGINIHRANPDGKSYYVGGWSAGCQVFADVNDFNEFMRIAYIAQAKHGKNFTYTLILSSDIS